VASRVGAPQPAAKGEGISTAAGGVGLGRGQRGLGEGKRGSRLPAATRLGAIRAPKARQNLLVMHCVPAGK